MWHPSMYDYGCNKAVKTAEYFDIKNCSCEKRLIGELGIECEDKILDTIANLLHDKKLTLAKVNYLIQTIWLIIICLLLLVVIFVSYFYYTKYWSKYLLPFNKSSIKFCYFA